MNTAIVRKVELHLFDLDKKVHGEKGRDKGKGNDTKGLCCRPKAICPRCKQSRKWRFHHGWPRWIDKRLKVLGLIPDDTENNDFDKLCDNCHAEIEEINRKFEAVRMESCKPTLLEIKNRFIAGEVITDETIILMARSIDSPSCIVDEQNITQKTGVVMET